MMKTTTSLLRRHDLEIMSSSPILLVLLFFVNSFVLAQSQRLGFLFPPEGPLHHHHHLHHHLLSQGSSHHSKITLPFNDGFVILDLPKNALRLPKSVTRKQGRLNNNSRHQRLQSQLSNSLSSTPKIIADGAQSHWEPVFGKMKKKKLPWDALVAPSQTYGSTATGRDTMTLFIPTVSHTNRVNSINEQLPSYQNRPSFIPRPTTQQQSANVMQGQYSQAAGQQNKNNVPNVQELAPLFVPIDSPPNRNLQGTDADNIIPNELLEQILAEVIPKIEAEDRSKSHASRQTTPFVQMVAQVAPRGKDEGFSYITMGEALQPQQSSNGGATNLVQKPRPFPSFKSTIQSFKMNNYPAPPRPITQQQQQPEVQQQQQQEEEPIVQVKEQMQTYDEPEPVQQQQSYEPPSAPPAAPVKGYNNPTPSAPRPAPAPVKGFSRPIPPTPEIKGKK